MTFKDTDVNGFAQVLRAEWAKVRTTRGWVAGMVIAMLGIVLPGLLYAAGSRTACTRGTMEEACAAPPVGPGGEAVRDRFFFLNRQLDGDGSITVRVGPMTGRVKETVGLGLAPVPGVVPWAKAGIMIKKSVEQGAAYAAVTRRPSTASGCSTTSPRTRPAVRATGGCG